MLRPLPKKRRLLRKHHSMVLKDRRLLTISISALTRLFHFEPGLRRLGRGRIAAAAKSAIDACSASKRSANRSIRWIAT